MKPIDFPGSTHLIAKDQKEYTPLPAHVLGNTVTFVWQLTWHERFIILLRGRIWQQVITFRKPLQPQRLLTSKPELY